MLAVILGYVDLAIQESDTSRSIDEYLTEIKEAAQRSANLTSQLLTFARKQAGTYAVFDLNAHIQGILNMLHRLIGKRTEIVFDGQEGLWNIYADLSQIDQIITNLVSNAADAVAGNEKIGIRTRNVSVDSSDQHLPSVPGEYVELSVWDTGKGMDDPQLDRFFEPFYTTKEIGKGTGLGLPMVYGIVTQHGGEIKVESRKGEGSTFRVFLPRTDMEMTDEPSEEEGVITGSGARILLVEDEHPVRKFTASALEQNGYDVIPCGTPEEALDVLKQNTGSIDLMITDLVMPGMNGRELWEYAEWLVPGIKVLYISGYPSAVFSEEEQLEIHLLHKPFTINSLLRKLHELL